MFPRLVARGQSQFPMLRHNFPTQNLAGFWSILRHGSSKKKRTDGTTFLDTVYKWLLCYSQQGLLLELEKNETLKIIEDKLVGE